jgi:hypothetical protein
VRGQSVCRDFTWIILLDHDLQMIAKKMRLIVFIGSYYLTKRIV